MLVLSCLAGGAGRLLPVSPAAEPSETGAPRVRAAVGVTTRPSLTAAVRRLDTNPARQPRVKFPSFHAAGASGSILSVRPAFAAEQVRGGSAPPVYSRLSVARPSGRGPPSV